MPRLVKDFMTEQLTDNPLLVERFPIEFEAVKAEHVEPAIQLLLEQMNQRLIALGGPDTPRTYRDILLALDQMTEPLDFAMALVRHLEGRAGGQRKRREGKARARSPAVFGKNGHGFPPSRRGSGRRGQETIGRTRRGINKGHNKIFRKRSGRNQCL
jgi:hypothetical protein